MSRDNGWFIEEIAPLISVYKSRLSLEEWTIHLGDGSMLAEGEEGAIIRNDREKHATVHIHPDATNRQAGRILVHEMLHLVHLGVDKAVGGWDKERDADRYAEAVEVCLNMLTSALTNLEWTPIKGMEVQDAAK